jgi:hypothetical protein
VTADTHFVQAGDGPILIGAGSGTLACTCGHTLVQGFDAARFLAIGIQCARCGTLTATAPLPEGGVPPPSAIIAAPSLEPRDTAMTVPAGMTVIGQAEMVRLRALFQPANPDYVYQFSDALLDEAAAAFALHTGAPLPEIASGVDAFAGMDQHALSWAVRHLRGRIRTGSWACAEDPASGAAVTIVAGFLHFLATWTPRHPLLPAMVATAAERGFSLHGLAPFAAAHCLIMQGNRVRLPEPQGYPGRIERFDIVAGADLLGVQIAMLDRFEFLFGAAWSQAGLLAVVSETLEGVQGRINLRNPGVLVLSAGNAQTGYDEALIRAVQEAMQTVGRRNRGLMAVAPVTLRLQALPDPHAIRFCYGFFPVANRHYRGEHRLAGQQAG